MQKTIQNLASAFVGESQARNRYTFYAKIAQKEGYQQIGGIFLETAEQEKTHAKRLFEHIQEIKTASKEKINEIKVQAEVPVVYGNTMENLAAAITGENYEHTQMYPEFAKIAAKEGYAKIAARLRSIAKAEEHHEERYKKLLDQLKAKTVLKKKEKVWWMCRECGYIYYGAEPPKECPSCDHPRGFYQVKCEQY